VVGTAGTPIFVNTAASGYLGNLIDLQANTGSKFSVDQTGNRRSTWASSLSTMLQRSGGS